MATKKTLPELVREQMADCTGLHEASLTPSPLTSGTAIQALADEEALRDLMYQAQMEYWRVLSRGVFQWLQVLVCWKGTEEEVYGQLKHLGMGVAWLLDGDAYASLHSYLGQRIGLVYVDNMGQPIPGRKPVATTLVTHRQTRDGYELVLTPETFHGEPVDNWLQRIAELRDTSEAS